MSDPYNIKKPYHWSQVTFTSLTQHLKLKSMKLGRIHELFEDTLRTLFKCLCLNECVYGKKVEKSLQIVGDTIACNSFLSMWINANYIGGWQQILHLCYLKMILLALQSYNIHIGHLCDWLHCTQPYSRGEKKKSRPSCS